MLQRLFCWSCCQRCRPAAAGCTPCDKLSIHMDDGASHALFKAGCLTSFCCSPKVEHECQKSVLCAVYELSAIEVAAFSISWGEASVTQLGAVNIPQPGWEVLCVATQPRFFSKKEFWAQSLWERSWFILHPPQAAQLLGLNVSTIEVD